MKITRLIFRSKNRGNKCALAFLVSSILLPLNVVATVTFVDSFSLSSQDSLPRGIAFNTDGTKMFVVGGGGDEVNEYTLTTGFDVSTVSFVDAFALAKGEKPRGVGFNTDGTKMFIVGQIGDDANALTAYINAGEIDFKNIRSPSYIYTKTS